MPSRASKRKASRQRQDADELRRHLDAEEDDDEPGCGKDGPEIDERAGLEEVEGRQDGEGDDPHAVRQLGVGEEGRRQSHANEVGRQHRLAAGDGGHARQGPRARGPRTWFRVR